MPAAVVDNSRSPIEPGALVPSEQRDKQDMSASQNSESSLVCKIISLRKEFAALGIDTKRLTIRYIASEIANWQFKSKQRRHAGANARDIVK